MTVPRSISHLPMFPRFLVLTSSIISVVSSFAVVDPKSCARPLVRKSSASKKSPSCSSLLALTDRQMQFWEDVEDGLDDIGNFYREKGQDIDRIRGFGRSARGEVSLPTGYGPLHQPSEEHIDDLTAKPFWPSSSFTWAEELESKSHIIIDEFSSKLSSSSSSMFSSDSSWQNSVMGTGWSAFRLQRLGVWNTENCMEFPLTYELLRSLKIPLAVRGVCFARQTPGSGVAPHSDGRNFILTSHLGLKVPKEAWLSVGEEKGGWEEGKLTTIDTSFQHATGNPTEEERHVLIIDFWHPELSEAERESLEFVYDLRNKYENGNVPYRKPRFVEKEEEVEGVLSGLWNSFTDNFTK